MTEKQEKILNVAIKLFAENGFNATSTSKIAKEASVSEGLIFKHFKNKEGLRDAIVNLGMEKMEEPFAKMASIEDPKARFNALLDLTTIIREEDYHFWRFMMALKWQQTGDVNDSKSEPLILFIEQIFNDLDYRDARLEAVTLLTTLEGMWTAVLLGKNRDIEGIKRILRSKYI